MPSARSAHSSQASSKSAARRQRPLTVAIVDDGSTDETYETACELARDFPQVCVFRQPLRGGLGPVLEQVRLRLGVTEAIVHDGIGTIDVHELAAMLTTPSGAATQSEPPALEGRGSRRFAAVTALNARMAHAASQRAVVPMAAAAGRRSVAAPYCRACPVGEFSPSPRATR